VLVFCCRRRGQCLQLMRRRKGRRKV
jgi:hypothetical protein